MLQGFIHFIELSTKQTNKQKTLQKELNNTH